MLQVVALIFFILILLFYFLITAAIIYHFKEYNLSPTVTRKMMSVFLGVSFVFFALNFIFFSRIPWQQITQALNQSVKTFLSF